MPACALPHFKWRRLHSPPPPSSPITTTITPPPTHPPPPRQADLEEAKKKELMGAIQAHFKDWLQATGAMRQVGRQARRTPMRTRACLGQAPASSGEGGTRVAALVLAAQRQVQVAHVRRSGNSPCFPHGCIRQPAVFSSWLPRPLPASLRCDRCTTWRGRSAMRKAAAAAAAAAAALPPASARQARPGAMLVQVCTLSARLGACSKKLRGCSCDYTL